MVSSRSSFGLKYRLGAKLGVGQCGTVCEAVERSSGKKFAVKIILKTSRCALGVRRLQNEIEIALFLSQGPGLCDRIVSTVEALEDGDRLFVVMELMRGGTLAEYVTRHKATWQHESLRKSVKLGLSELEEAQKKRMQLVEIEAAWILHSLASALHHLHSHGIVHRDVKPENVMIRDPVVKGHWVSGLRTEEALKAPSSFLPKLGGAWKHGIVAPSTILPNGLVTAPNAVKLADLGFAEFIDPEGTPQRELVGSPSYLAPEVIQGSVAGTASDIWALGVLLYFLLTGGELPFRARTIPLLLRSIRTAYVDMDSPSLLGVSLDAKGVLQCLLASDPKQRLNCSEILVLPWVQEQLNRRDAMVCRSVAIGVNT